MPVRPVIRAGNLATAPVNYEHSSASYYITGKQGLYEVFNYAALADIDLTKRLVVNAESTGQHTKAWGETSASKR